MPTSADTISVRPKTERTSATSRDAEPRSQRGAQGLGINASGSSGPATLVRPAQAKVVNVSSRQTEATNTTAYTRSNHSDQSKPFVQSSQDTSSRLPTDDEPRSPSPTTMTSDSELYRQSILMTPIEFRQAVPRGIASHLTPSATNPLSSDEFLDTMAGSMPRAKSRDRENRQREIELGLAKGSLSRKL